MTTTERPTKPKRETWRAWLPDGAPEPSKLFTREEVLDALAREGVEADERDLRHWEQVGALPRPVRQWHRDAVRATYPWWYVYLVKQLRRAQRDEGAGLHGMDLRLRAYLRALLAYIGDKDPDEVVNPYPSVRAPEDIALWPALVNELERLSRWWSHLSGTPAGRIEVHVVGTNGRATKYPLPLAPLPDDPDATL